MLEGVRAFARSKAGCGALARRETLRLRVQRRGGLRNNAAHPVAMHLRNLGADAGSRRPQPRCGVVVEDVRGQASAPAAAYARMPPRRQRPCKKKRFFWKGAQGQYLCFLSRLSTNIKFLSDLVSRPSCRPGAGPAAARPRRCGTSHLRPEDIRVCVQPMRHSHLVTCPLTQWKTVPRRLTLDRAVGVRLLLARRGRNGSRALG